MLVNKRQLSEIIGCDESSLTEWQKQPGFPIRKRGAGRQGNIYETSDVIKWLEARRVDSIVGGPTSIDFEEAKRRKMAAEAALVELELAKEQGAVVSIDAVAKEVSANYSALRAKLLSIPSKTANLVFTSKDIVEAKRILEDAIIEALNELVGNREEDTSGETEPDSTDSDEGEAEATTSADSERVG